MRCGSSDYNPECLGLGGAALPRSWLLRNLPGYGNGDVFTLAPAVDETSTCATSTPGRTLSSSQCVPAPVFHVYGHQVV